MKQYAQNLPSAKASGSGNNEIMAPFAGSHGFASALNNVNGQLMQEYIATDGSEVGLKDKLSDMIKQDAIDRRLNEIFNLQDYLSFD